MRNIVETEEAVFFLRQQASSQLESIQVLMDGVTLAAEQVQDKRLELLEAGPELSASDMFLEFALVVLLESNLVGALVSKSAARVLRRRALSQSVCKKTVQMFTDLVSGGKVSGRMRLIEKQLGRALKAEVASVGPETIKSIGKWTRSLRVLSNAGEGRLEALAKAVKAVDDKSGESKSARFEFDPTDTPGVSILDLTQSYCQNHRVAISYETGTLEFYLRIGFVSPEHVYSLFESPAADADSGNIKDRHKRFFELVIWTLLLKARSFTGKSTTDWVARVGNPQEHVPASLLKYWVRRFINPTTGRPFRDEGFLSRPDKPESPIDLSVGALARHMIDIGRKAEGEFARLLDLSKDSFTKQDKK